MKIYGIWVRLLYLSFRDELVDFLACIKWGHFYMSYSPICSTRCFQDLVMLFKDFSKPCKIQILHEKNEKHYYNFHHHKRRWKMICTICTQRLLKSEYWRKWQCFHKSTYWKDEILLSYFIYSFQGSILSVIEGNPKYKPYYFNFKKINGSPKLKIFLFLFSYEQLFSK